MKCLGLILLLVGGCTHAQKHGLVRRDEKPPLAKEFRAQSIQRGKALYRENCMACHGKNGHGDGVVAMEQGIKAANLKQTIREMKHFHFYLQISQWEGSMPGWKKRHYSEADKEDLVEYLKTFR